MTDLLSKGWREWTDPDLQETILIPPPVPMQFVAHPLAPNLSDPTIREDILKDFMSEMESDPATWGQETFQLVREASLTSMWFFLKYVAGAFGPYNGLTDHIHMDICNFRQRMLQPGARGAIFIPRSFYKSTIVSHGADTWELLRDPNLRIGIVASKTEMAEQFMSNIQRNFDSNPLIEYLFPDHCPDKGEKGNVLQKPWNSQMMLMPNRTRNMPEPSVKTMGAGGNTQGNHFDLLNADDLIGEAQLDSSRGSSQEMFKIGNWFSSNKDTLLISPKKSRVFVAATRYGVDDIYEEMYQDCKEQLGYWDELPHKTNPDGEWTIYHRMAEERGQLIFPEKVDQKFLDRIKERDQWKYYTQYLNNPYSAQQTEFADYTVRECEVDFSVSSGYKILYQLGPQGVSIPLEKCKVYLGIDPAASEKKTSNTTSRSAIVVLARDDKGNRFVIDGSVGYYDPVKFYDEIFRLYSKYKNYVDATYMESGGPFRFVYNTLVAEQRKRNTWLGLRKVTPLPDKDGKLRNYIQPILEKNYLFAAKPIRKYLAEELTVFPGGNKRDTMDALEVADRNAVIAMAMTESEYEEEEEYDYRANCGKAGY